MNKKEKLLKIFEKTSKYNYHIIKKDNLGHLIYIINNNSELHTKSLEFKMSTIPELLLNKCFVVSKRIAPNVFFTDELSTNLLKNKLNIKFVESKDFSNFIEKVKNEYFISTINDYLQYIKNPEEYNKNKQKEYNDNQKRLLKNIISQINLQINSKLTKRQLNFNKDSNKELNSKLNNPKYKGYEKDISEVLNKRNKNKV